jgi:hypothetical protein
MDPKRRRHYIQPIIRETLATLARLESRREPGRVDPSRVPSKRIVQANT